MNREYNQKDTSLSYEVVQSTIHGETLAKTVPINFVQDVTEGYSETTTKP